MGRCYKRKLNTCLGASPEKLNNCCGILNGYRRTRTFPSFIWTENVTHEYEFGNVFLYIPDDIRLFLFVFSFHETHRRRKPGLRKENDKYFVNKPLQEAGVWEDNARYWMIVDGREPSLPGQLWNFENNLSTEGIIMPYTSKPERGGVCLFKL